jgi:16S rRNA (cytidine1402-2'-O)-methyltransferase
MKTPATVYLIPANLEENSLEVIPAYVIEAIHRCQVFFVENERSARRYIKQLSKEFVIDDHEWHVIQDAGHEVLQAFRKKILEGRTIGILSEAGCPGIADPGQALVEVAQSLDAIVKPLVGPSSILLALMASGMNGQRFEFTGYLPIQEGDRAKAIRELEATSAKKQSTQVFIETPYRNNQLFQSLLKNAQPSTRLCIAMDITGKNEWIKTRSISEWKNKVPELHKRLVIFCLLAVGNG